VTYDITDRKRLKRVGKLLLRYGHRVQKSVFACDISERRVRELASKLRRERKPGDSIMIYEYRAETAEEIEGEVRSEETASGKREASLSNESIRTKIHKKSKKTHRKPPEKGLTSR